MWITLILKFLPTSFISKITESKTSILVTIGCVILIILTTSLIFQTYRFNKCQEEIDQLKLNEIGYQLTIKNQAGLIKDIQELVKKNETAFQEYVQTTKNRAKIVKEAQSIYIKKGAENEIGIVDTETSKKIKGFFNDRFASLENKLKGSN